MQPDQVKTQSDKARDPLEAIGLEGDVPLVILDDGDLSSLLHQDDVVLVDSQSPDEVTVEPAEEAVELEVIPMAKPSPAVDRPTEEEIDDELEHTDEDYERAPLPQLCRVLFWVTAGTLGLLLTVGWPYYKLPIMGRAFHHDYDTLRPSGTLGLMLGIVGTVLMAVSLLYLLRKKYASWSRFGSLQNWMGFHMLTSMTGVGLLIFHANFIPYSDLTP